MKYKIEESITNAKRGKSKLVPDILSMQGMSSDWNRHLLNNILEPGGNYLEVGVWHGSTFISALYRNRVNAYAIDNWSEYNDDDSKRNFFMNCNRFGISGYVFFECDAFKVDLNKILDKIDVFFYDGDHNYEQTKQSLSYFFPVLEDEFLFIVDDYGWEGVNFGVRDGIKEAGLDIVEKWELFAKEPSDKDTWWNGLGIFKLRKYVES